MAYPYIPATTGPVDSDAFVDLLQAAIVGVMGFAGNLVRPSWQIDPPVLPAQSVNWCGFQVKQIMPDADPIIKTQGAGGTLERAETVEVLVSMYGPAAMGNCGVLRDGLNVPFNREVLRSQGIAVVGYGETVHVPELIGERWYDRADLPLTMTRNVLRAYRILSLISANGVIHGHGPDPTINEAFSVHQ